jgi:Hypoxia induced protein conserved region
MTMNLLTLMFIASVLAVIGSMGLGIAAMGRNGEVMHHTSAEWMSLRVLFQALAVVNLLVLAWLA